MENTDVNNENLDSSATIEANVDSAIADESIEKEIEKEAAVVDKESSAWVVETTVGSRHEKHFRRIDHFPFTVGRAYDNDLILSDDTVSPYHLVIESSEEGTTLRNLSTENGTWLDSQALDDKPHKLSAQQSLALGHAQIKILSTQTVIAPTRSFHHTSWLSRKASDLRVALSLLACYLLLSVYFAFEKQSRWLDWQEVFINQIFEIVLPLVVATIVGFICRILLHRWRFSLQLSIACIALTVYTFSNEAISEINYWLTSDQIANNISTVILTLCFVGLMAWQLRAISTLSRKRAGWISVAIVIPVFLIWELQALVNQPSFSSMPPMHTALKAGDHRLAQSLGSIGEIRQLIQQELADGIEKEMLESVVDKTSTEKSSKAGVNVEAGLSLFQFNSAD